MDDYKTVQVSEIGVTKGGRPPGRWLKLREFLLSQPEGIAVDVELKEGETALAACNSAANSLRVYHDIKFALRGDKLYAYRNGHK